MNYKKLTCLHPVLLILAFTIVSVTAQVNIIPEPYSMTVGSGSFNVPTNITIFADAASDTTPSWLIELFTQTGSNASMTADESSAHIVVKIITDNELVPCNINSATYSGKI